MNETILLIVFAIVIAFMLALDLGVFNRKQHAIHLKEATIWSTIWIIIACLFGVFVYYEFGTTKATEYFAAYLTEKSLSLDNIFVFVLIFAFYTSVKLQ
jgi:tellurite resistance protein TerC